MLSKVQQAHTMCKAILLAVVLMGALTLGTVQVGADNNCTYYNSGGMFNIWVTPGYWWTVEVDNANNWGYVGVEVYDYCWQDWWGYWHCTGFDGSSGDWTGWAYVNFYATDGLYYAWVDTGGNSIWLCVY
jgi:hypothetical protein